MTNTTSQTGDGGLSFVIMATHPQLRDKIWEWPGDEANLRLVARMRFNLPSHNMMASFILRLTPPISIVDK